MSILSNPFTGDDDEVDVDRLDHWINRAQQAMPLFVLAGLILTVAVLVAVNSRNDDNEAAACRSIINNEVNAANTDILTRIGWGLYGLYRNDPTLGQEKIDGFPESAKRAESAVARQRAAAALGAADPGKFLAECRARKPKP